MNKTQTLEDFYAGHAMANKPSLNGNNGYGHFNVYRREEFMCKSCVPYSRRDFYKITFIEGTGVLHYADKSIELNNNTLLFSNPNVPYSWEITSKKQTGYFCLFTEDFFKSGSRHDNLSENPMYRIGGHPVFFPDEAQQKNICFIFEKMLEEMESEYAYKYDLMHNYINLLMHEAMKMRPAETFVAHSNASSRIANLFIELMERQFPIDTPANTLKLKTAKDYASRLSVHVNHLNRAVKEITGKTTTEHVADRIINEAKALLIHTDWNISEIGYALGFEYPSYFNNFFKKQTSVTPRAFRSE